VAAKSVRRNRLAVIVVICLEPVPWCFGSRKRIPERRHDTTCFNFLGFGNLFDRIGEIRISDKRRYQ